MDQQPAYAGRQGRQGWRSNGQEKSCRVARAAHQAASLEMGTAGATCVALENGSHPTASLHPTLKHTVPKKGKKGISFQRASQGNEFSHHICAFPLHEVSVGQEGRAWGK